MRDAAKALDDVSDHMGEVLRQADALLAEWQGFAGKVRAQVEHEARTIGDAVGSAIDEAIARGVEDAVARAMGERLTAQLAQLAGELAKLENRARASARSIADQRRVDRRAWWFLGAGLALANALLVVLVLREPAAPPPEAPPAPIVVPAATMIAPDAAVVETPAPPPIEPAGSAAVEAKPTIPAKPAATKSATSVRRR
jgi:hypothetical protein